MADVVRVRAGILGRMAEEAQRTPEQECCGLLGGRDAIISAIFPARNALASPSAFEIAPEELFHVFRQIRAAGLEHLGIYHSHPAGDNWPSPRDIELAYYPDATYFILSPRQGARHAIRAFAIRGGQVAELTIEAVHSV